MNNYEKNMNTTENLVNKLCEISLFEEKQLFSILLGRIKKYKKEFFNNYLLIFF